MPTFAKADAQRGECRGTIVGEPATLAIDWFAPPKQRGPKRPALALEDGDDAPVEAYMNDGFEDEGEVVRTTAGELVDDPAGELIISTTATARAKKTLREHPKLDGEDPIQKMVVPSHDARDDEIVENLAFCHNLGVAGLGLRGGRGGAKVKAAEETLGGTRGGDSLGAGADDPEDAEEVESRRMAGDVATVWNQWSKAAAAGNAILAERQGRAAEQMEDLRGLFGRKNPACSLAQFEYTWQGADGTSMKETRVGFVTWELCGLRGQVLAVVDGRVAYPVLGWQNKNLFQPRTFGPTQNKLVVVLPNTNVRFAIKKTDVPVPADVIQLRRMWLTALDGGAAGSHEGLVREDCILCKHLDRSTVSAPSAGGSTKRSMTNPSRAGDTENVSPVAWCPHCLLCWHEACARAIATAGKASPALACPAFALPIGSLGDRDPFKRDVLCAMCRQWATRKRRGGRGKANK